MDSAEIWCKGWIKRIMAVSNQVAWASGARATVIRTIDGGKTWEDVSIRTVEEIDFRDIEAFDENTAIVLSADLPAVIYKTMDGGKSWDLEYSSTVAGTFYDAMDFWNNNEGIAFGDAMDGRLLILRTFDGGEKIGRSCHLNRGLLLLMGRAVSRQVVLV